jgi:glutamine synthetase
MHDTSDLDLQTVTARARAAGIRQVRLFFADMLGANKCVVIPVSDLAKALDGRVTFDGGSIDGFARDQEIDMILKPDPLTFALLPHADGALPEARLLCEIAMPDGKPFEGCSRMALRRILGEAQETLPNLRTRIEVEFYLFIMPSEDDTPVTHDPASYFDVSFCDRGESVRSEIVAALEEMGIAVAAAHHEHAPSQHEIDLGEGSVLAAADALFTLRMIAKEVAARHGMLATFMPKPLENSAGSGLHFYFDWGPETEREEPLLDPLVSLKAMDGREAVDPEADSSAYALDEELDLDAQELQAILRDRREEPNERLYAVGGLLAHALACTAICNPLVNSYKRIVTAWDAPVYTVWSHRSANALVRMPSDHAASTLEVRSPDPSCNPYLALAVLIASMLDGFRRKRLPGAPFTGNTYTLTNDERIELGIRQLPKSLRQALLELERDVVVRNALGDHIYRAFNDVKRREYEAYRRAVHPWERKTYLRRY